MSIEVLISESMMNATKDVVYKVIEELSVKYNFDSEEAIRNIGLNVKSLKSLKSSKALGKGEDKSSKSKSKFALPYSGELDESCCQGLSKNQGLYTQCKVNRMASGSFCSSCQASAELNNGVPEYGTIEARLKAYTEGIEFKDPSGKSPIPYVKIMKKLKVSREEVEEEAGKLNMVINPIHFETDAVKKSGRPAKLEKKKPEGEVKPKGRPKKAKKVLELAGEEEDLFASLVMSANKNDSASEDEDNVDEDADTVIMTESEGEEEAKLAAKLAAEEAAKLAAKLAAEEEAKLAAKLAAEEEAKLAAKLAAEEEAKLAAKLAAEKEAKKEAERLEKEAKKKAAEDEKEAKKKAADAKKEAERLEKEAKKKAAEEKKEAERLEKEAKKKAAEDKKPKKEGKKPASSEVTSGNDAVEEEEEEQDIVRRFEFEGKKYLKSTKTGIIYNMEQDKIGKWNEAKQRIDFDVIEEESCDEYEE
jgi:hypothetical protein